MDSSVVLLYSPHLEGIPPSMYSPPLAEKNRQFRKTTSHFDSHTMGDHEDEIPEMFSLSHEVGEEDPAHVYDPSP